MPTDEEEQAFKAAFWRERIPEPIGYRTEGGQLIIPDLDKVTDQRELIKLSDIFFKLHTIMSHRRSILKLKYLNCSHAAKEEYEQGIERAYEDLPKGVQWRKSST